jgi:predicted acetyltransferase
MTPHGAEPPAHLEVIEAAPAQAPILANLLELYAHDFSEFHDVAPGPDGRFGYPRLPLYWSEPGRHPFLVRIDHNPAGFVLVKRGSDLTGNQAAYDITEFFVMRRYRRRGMGTRIAHEVWKRFPGPWEVRVMPSNTSACQFWARAIAAFTGEQTQPVRLHKGNDDWHLFRFESRGQE